MIGAQNGPSHGFTCAVIQRLSASGKLTTFWIKSACEDKPQVVPDRIEVQNGWSLIHTIYYIGP